MTDPTLSSSLILYPVKKILHMKGETIHLCDDIYSGETWWNIQVNFFFTHLQTFLNFPKFNRISSLIVQTSLTASYLYITGWIKAKSQVLYSDFTSNPPSTWVSVSGDSRWFWKWWMCACWIYAKGFLFLIF